MFFRINQKNFASVFLFFCLLVITTQMKAQPAMSLSFTGVNPSSGLLTAPASAAVNYSINVQATIKFYLNGSLVSTVVQGYSGSYSFTYSNLPPGTNTLSATATAPWASSDTETMSYVVNNAVPTASISSITPNPANWGASVSFSGSGTDPDGGAIQAYNWRSSISGQLSTSASFSTTSLSPGTHTIYFKVQDNENAWSNEVSTTLTINNALPYLSISYISPTSGTYGQTFTGGGSAGDPDGGTIQAYKWVSSINGVISNTNTFSTILSVGTHTLTFSAQDNEGAWSSTTTTVTVNNALPTASISSITPNPANWGAAVSFSGSGTDPDGGAIQAYNWRTDISGQLSTSASFNTSSLPPGTHTIYFKVQDNEGAWSSEASATLTINNVLPTASIGSITPNPANWGTSVSFSGSGTDPDGGTIQGYNWRSSIDGQLSTSASFSTSSLSVGTHTIYFKVQDNESAWSSEASTTLTINNALPVPSINYISPTAGYYGQTFTGAGNASDPDGGTIQAYQWVCSGVGPISSTNTFSLTGNLSPGTYTLTFYAQDNEGAWASTSTSITIYNSLPTASIGSIAPNPANWGTSVSFSGSGSDTDGGTIQGYNWRSNINGDISTSDSFNYSSLSPGTHTIYFKVKDNENTWSNEVSQTLTINNVVPTAAITSISHTKAVQGTSVTFNGSGTDTDGGAIQAYNWRSNIDGNFGSTVPFSTSSLSVGNHIIYFKVQDNEGAWSNEDVDLVTIYPPTSITIDNITRAIGSGFSPLDYEVTFTCNQSGTVNMAFYSSGYDAKTFDINSAGTYKKIMTAPSPGNFTIHASLTTTYITVDDFESFTIPNTLPSASINSISPNPADWNTPVSFSGSGYDPDFGTIQGYNWRSSINGDFGIVDSLDYSALSPGTHTIYLKVKDDETAWGNETNQTLTINNALPAASITYVSKTSAQEGTKIDFVGNGTDPDGGAIQAYSWRSNLTGFLNSSYSFSDSTLSAGNHVIFFKVQDDEGDWSNETAKLVSIYPYTSITIDTVQRAIGSGFSPLDYEVTLTYNQPGTINMAFYSSGYGAKEFTVDSAGTIKKIMTAPSTGDFTIKAALTTTYTTAEDFYSFTVGNVLPYAIIDSITPNPAVWGSGVTFNGSGGDSDGGAIQAYNWRSSIDNDFGTTVPYATSSLSPGIHTIYFKVMDDENTWSAEDSTTLSYLPSPPEITSFNLSGGGEYTLSTNVSLNFTIASAVPITHYRASEFEDFSGAEWLPFTPAATPVFELSGPYGTKTVYLQVKTEWNQSTTASDGILKAGIKIIGVTPSSGSEPVPDTVDVEFTTNPGTVNFYVDTNSVGNELYGNSTYHFPFTNLNAGTRVLKVSVSNERGTSTDYINYIINEKLAITKVEPASPSTMPDTVKLFFTRNFEGAYDIFDNGVNIFTGSANSGTVVYGFPNLSAGEHILKAASGSLVDSVNYIVTDPPVVNITGINPPSGTEPAPDSVTISFNTDKPGLASFYADDSLLDTLSVSAGSNERPLKNIEAGTRLLTAAVTGTNGTGSDTVSYTLNKNLKIIGVDPLSSAAMPDTVKFSFFKNYSGVYQIYKKEKLAHTDSAGIGNFTYNFVKLPAGNHTFKVVSVGLVDSLLYLVNLDRTKTISYKYDNLGSITEINADSNFVFKYSYDAQARLKEVKSKAPNSAETVDAVYNYNSADQVDYFTPGLIGTVDYTYDTQRGWLTDITHAGGMFTENLTYLANGNVNTQTIHNYGDGAWGNYTYSFVYDNMNRLTNANSTVVPSESYVYNGDGRFESKNRSGNNITYNYTNSDNKIESATVNGSNYSFAYDTKGNVTYDGLNNALLGNYSFRNLPTTMNNFNYTYNDNGERIKKLETDSARTEYYLRDYLGRELVVYNYETNDPKQVNIYGNGLIGKIEIDTTETRSYYLKDHLGNIRCAINNDGTLLNAQDYYPYGETIRQFNNTRYMLTEKERDTESGNDYFGARYYNSKLGVWLQVDPLSEKYPGWSPYNYALCNPMIFTDPDGMDTTSVHANIRYDYEEDTETFTETTTDEASSSFTIVTTNTAAVNANGEVISTSKQVTYIQKEDGGELVTQMPVEQGSLSNFSSGVQTNINNAIKYRLNNDSGSWSQAFVKEYNAVRARRDNNELGFNIITTLVFPPKFSTIANSLLSIGNLGVSAYGIYGAAKDNRINPNSNLIIRIK